MRKRLRITKSEYYLEMARTASQRGTCLRRIFGAILVSRDTIVGTGYCGSPRGAKNCSDTGHCLREELGIPSGEQYEKCKSVHAEVNAIIAAGLERAIGGVMYVFGIDMVTGDKNFVVEPCSAICKKVIINAGIETVITGNLAGDRWIFKVQDWVRNEKYMEYGGGNKRHA